MNKIEHKKTQYTKSSSKKFFLYLIFTLLVFQNSIGQESIVIPDISIEIESDTFSFDKDAIPDFKIEPIKEEPIVVIEKVEKVIEEKEVVSPTIVEEIKEVQVVSENRNLGFFAGSNFCYSSNEFFVSPLFDVYIITKKDFFSISIQNEAFIAKILSHFEKNKGFFV